MALEQLAELPHRDRRVGVHVAVARFVRGAGGVHQLVEVGELGHEAVDRWPSLHAAGSSSTRASGSMVRISKIEIIGRKRMKRKKSVRKRPMLPRNIDQSQRVPVKSAHDDGRKSADRLTTMMM